MENKTIAFYCDATVYSGHDIMSVHIANLLSAQYKVHFLFTHPAYHQNLDRKVVRKQLSLKNAKTGLVNLLMKSWKDIFAIKRMFREINPDVIIVCQGELHMCLKGLFAALMAGSAKVLSYIPIGYPYSIKQSDSFFFKSTVYRFIVRRFHAFITISVEQEKMLYDFIRVDRPVYVLENLTDFPSIKISRKKRNYTAYGIISRIQKSKGQYKTIAIAEKVKKNRQDFKFVLFGEGEDEEGLRKIITEKRLDEYFEFKGWVDDRKKIYSDIDVLLLLSEVEGVPLVFLEALFFETPIMANHLINNPIYERYIDNEFIFYSADELADKIVDIEKYLTLFKRKSKSYKKLMIERHGRKNFEKNLFELFAQI